MTVVLQAKLDTAYTKGSDPREMGVAFLSTCSDTTVFSSNVSCMCLCVMRGLRLGSGVGYAVRPRCLPQQQPASCVMSCFARIFVSVRTGVSWTCSVLICYDPSCCTSTVHRRGVTHSDLPLHYSTCCICIGKLLCASWFFKQLLRCARYVSSTGRSEGAGTALSPSCLCVWVFACLFV